MRLFRNRNAGGAVIATRRQGEAADGQRADVEAAKRFLIRTDLGMGTGLGISHVAIAIARIHHRELPEWLSRDEIAAVDRKLAGDSSFSSDVERVMALLELDHVRRDPEVAAALSLVDFLRPR